MPSVVGLFLCAIAETPLPGGLLVEKRIANIGITFEICYGFWVLANQHTVDNGDLIKGGSVAVAFGSSDR